MGVGSEAVSMLIVGGTKGSSISSKISSFALTSESWLAGLNDAKTNEVLPEIGFEAFLILLFFLLGCLGLTLTTIACQILDFILIEIDSPADNSPVAPFPWRIFVVDSQNSLPSYRLDPLFI